MPMRFKYEEIIKKLETQTINDQIYTILSIVNLERDDIYLDIDWIVRNKVFAKVHYDESEIELELLTNNGIVFDVEIIEERVEISVYRIYNEVIGD